MPAKSGFDPFPVPPVRLGSRSAFPNGSVCTRPPVPRASTPGRHRDGETPLLHRIAIAAATLALAGGALVGGAVAAMPEGIPSAPVSAPPSGTASPTATPAVGRPSAPTAAALAIPAVLPARTTEASAYSAWDEGNFCPGLPQTRMMDLTVGSDLVPCGAYIRICLINGKRCVVARRTDWGPGLSAKRRIDMNLGVVRALGYRSLYHWGARQVRWEPVSNPARTVASAPAP